MSVQKHGCIFLTPEEWKQQESTGYKQKIAREKKRAEKLKQKNRRLLKSYITS